MTNDSRVEGNRHPLAKLSMRHTNRWGIRKTPLRLREITMTQGSFLVPSAGIEPAAFRFGGGRSIP